MFDYMDRLFRIVRPTTLLYLAVDGVAPRAKMNQQRARRFKSAKAAKDAEMEEKLLRDRFRAEGKELLPREASSSEISDPNVITPGTEFMENLSEALKYYIRHHLSSDPLWKDIKVILSDSNVPGEGEHKIMSFIRAQRGREGYDPNTRHCLYGLDADLIMLALASHEVHFSILREEVLHQNNQENTVTITEKVFTSQEAAKFKCRAWFPRITEAQPEGKLPKKPYQFLNIWVLREYLELDMKIQNPVHKLDMERIIDDFVFICFLTGNDFIPHIPSLEIHEGAVDLLIEVYKTSFNKMGGYIVDTDKEENLDDQGMMAKSSQAEGQDSTCRTDESDVTMNTLELRKNLKDILRNKQDLIKTGAWKHDKIKLGSPGWKSRFFKEKFGAETSDEIGKLQNEMGIAKLPFIDDKLLLSVTKAAEKELAVHELRRNTVGQEKIFLRNSNALASNEAFAQTSDCSLQKLPIDPATRSAMFFNPEAVKPATRLLDNVVVPDKTVTEADISVRPLWHTYPYSRPPVNAMHNVQQSCRPETPCWKSSTPAPQREEIRSAGTGWLGRGSGNAVAAATLADETRQSWISSRYGLVRGADNVDRGSYSLRPGGGGGVYQRQQQQTAWRPVGSSWGGGGRGGNRQPRAW
ncbi:hypothetical protein E2562_012472 [Oryza meyeriana var. granulata]|uniref:Uncharacterized protein n=1 Tax=Oryza meyeriana var. granulata TaxID=110450 RepID=A0A6G1C4S2_9ORYZ|nr:hypothetical protein E2562_012472 [Oryza meyeriana var. granulata]